MYDGLASAHLSGGNSNTGLIRFIADGSSFITDESAAAAPLPFLMMGIAGREKVVQTSGIGYNYGTGSSGANIEVTIRNHFWRPFLAD